MGLKLCLDEVSWRVVEGDIVLLDLRTSTYLTLNGSATELWLALVEGASADSLANLLVETYGLEREHAERDVEEFIADLQARNLAI